MQKTLFFLLTLCLLLTHCTRRPPKNASEALRLTDAPEHLIDGLEREPLIKALENQLAHLESPQTKISKFQFADKTLSVDQYKRGIKHFIDLAKNWIKDEDFASAVKRDFDFYKIFGQSEWGEVFMTSYFEPMIEGRRRKTKTFSQPLYRVPKDLVSVTLEPFEEALGRDFSSWSMLRGRIIKNKKTDPTPFTLVPYYSREEIDVKMALKRKGLEIAWVKPIDSFFLQVQGSGKIHFKNGKEIRVGYAEKNGHRYESIGKFMFDVIPKEKMTLHAIESYLESLPPEQMQNYLNMNPSYVFFKPLTGQALSYLGLEVTPRRTIATDRQFFPKGAIGFLQYEEPQFETQEAQEPASWKAVSHYVIDQDIGGAIKGAHRLDLFWGTGREAKQAAGVIKETGQMWYLAPKEHLYETAEMRSQ